MYTISKRENLDKEHYGWDTIYDITYNFTKRSCLVELMVDSEKPTELYISSQTDGYHWLHYFLAQEPNCDKMIEYGSMESRIVKALFDKHDIIYEPEDKETCYLHFPHIVTNQDINLVAKIIEERFANRERFFE